MGGDDSQKLGPGEDSSSPPGRSKPPVHSQRSTVTKLAAPMMTDRLPKGWVTFGEHSRVTSRKRRSAGLVRHPIDGSCQGNHEARG